MIKRIVYIIIAVAILGVSVFGIVQIRDIMKDGDSSDTTIADGIIAGVDGDGVNTDNSDTVAPDAGPAVAPNVKLGDDNLVLVYIDNESNGTCMVGYQVKGLNPNSRYVVNWQLNSAFLLATQADFKHEILNGISKPCIYWDKSYAPNEGLGERFCAADGSYNGLLTGNEGNGIIVTTGEDVKACVLFLFEGPYTSMEQANEFAKSLEKYVISLHRQSGNLSKGRG